MSTVTEWLLTGAGAMAATAPAGTQDDEALDGEFLDYLGTLEGDREDWTWFSESDKEQSSDDDETATEDAR